MPRVNTHLHAAMKLAKRIDVHELEVFYLGNVYPDCHMCSHEEYCTYYYKTDVSNDFNLGCLFHLWLDNYILQVDTEDISRYDCMICDIKEIYPIILELQKREFVGKEAEAMQKILELEAEPLPLYLVPTYKKEKYIAILDEAVELFVSWYEAVSKNVMV